MIQSDPPVQPNPKKDSFTKNISYTFLQKSISIEKFFSRTFEKTDHLAYPPSQPQKSNLYPQRTIFLA